MQPLSVRMRPDSLEEFAGQRHFLYPGSLFVRAVKNHNFHSAIFFGPPGTGKTTLARIIARTMDSEFHEINASVSGTRELKEILDGARLKFYGLQRRSTVLYVDEIHRWNKLQQDALLKALEEGVIHLIGSTTENPYFSVNKAILSRVRNIYEFYPLKKEDLVILMKRALKDPRKGLGSMDPPLSAEEDALSLLAEFSQGDARAALDTLGFIAENLPEDNRRITKKAVGEALQRKVNNYDESTEYDLLSALQKSIRGSDPDAAIYYFSRMADARCDLMTIGRRLMVIASEDIGMAYPSAVSIVTSCVQAAQMVGWPEAGINLSQAVILLASSPKSNSVVKAYQESLNDVRTREADPIPAHLRDAHYSGAGKLGYGKDYLYPHDFGGYVKQQYLPDNLEKAGVSYYHPTENGSEKQFKHFLRQLDEKLGNKKGKR
ncbi:MAG: replication-associated recombination protein A [Eubacterium sp.]|jgi:putative ATPase